MFKPAQIGVIASGGLRVPVPTTSDLTFTTNTNLINTAQVFTAVGGFGFGHTGLDNLFLAANENGRIWVQLVGAPDCDYVFGINTANAETGFAGMEVAFDRQQTTDELFRFMSNVIYDTLATVADGKYFGLYRVGPMWKAQISNDGVTWSDFPGFLFALNFSSAAAAYIVCDLHTVAVMSFPKITQYSAGNLGRNLIQDGDSIGLGFMTAPSNVSLTNVGYQTYAALQAVKETFYKNIAVSGASIVSRRAALAADCFTLFGQVGNSFNRIIICLNAGVNDLHSNSPAVTFANLLLYISDVLNQDERVFLLVNTVINADPAYVAQADIDSYNALVLGMTETARLKVANTTTEPLLTAVGACNNGTYYQADKVHQTQAGIDLLAAIQYAKALTFSL